MADFTASPVTVGQLTSPDTTTTASSSSTAMGNTIHTTPAKTTSATASSADPNTSLFQCGSCKRQYKRLDHLARHSSDLLKRHAAGHDAKSDAASTTGSTRSDGSSSLRSNSKSTAAASATRVSRACQACSSNHLRCSEAKPCQRCTSKGLQCVWDRAADMVVTPPATVQEEAETEDDRREDDTEQREDANNGDEDQDDMTETIGDTTEVTDMATTQNMDMTPTMPMQHAIQPMQGHVDDPPHSFMRMLSVFDFSYKGASSAGGATINNSNLPLTLPPDPMVNHAPGHWTPIGAQLEFDAAAAAAGSLDLNFDRLDDMDFRFLDAYNTRVPFEFGVSPTGDTSLMTTNRPELTSSTSPPAHNALASSSSAIGTGSEAFQRHYWKFRPNAQDHCGAEEHNLSLPSGGVVVDHTSPDSPLARHSHTATTTHTRLSTASRDRILMVVTHNCRRENVARVVTSFPSVELLDTLLQFYLTSPVAQASAWMHTPSFHDNPNDRRPELLAAMAAVGAVLTADSALSKLGFAIQECLRIAVPQQWEHDNSMTRDLELAQAYLLTLEMGLWSGRSRKVEIAESFFLPLLTMQRRDGSFARPRPVPRAVEESDEGDLLAQKWKSWIHREAVTRFTFRILQHDTNTSMALLTTPLVSYAEVLLAFPASEAMWGAATAEQWKQLYLDANSARSEDMMPATLPAFLEHPEAFLAAHRGRVDMGVVCSTFLSCAWGLTWEYVQMRVLQREMAATTPTTMSLLPGRRWNALAMGARQDEILQLVQSFRLATASLSVPDPTLAMRTELVLMHTHTVLEQVQLFAGMEGRDQARAVHPVIVEWVVSEAARTSLWHAGQIMRGARLLARGVVSGPTAVMVYHAGLTLWIYGSVAASLPGGHDGEDVLLDVDASPSLQRFFVHGQGRPCISSENGEVIALSRPDSVMAVVAGLFRRNHGKAARPHMVESLIQLLDEIQRASAEASLT
ncbi:hypothetical protein Sste5344_008453 [Sporothrix stenoceras]